MRKLKSILFLIILVGIFSCSKKNIKADILIKNGTVYNGTDTIPATVSIAIKDDKIVVYCGVEPRAILASKTLKDLGFTNVSYLKGGYFNWRDEGYETSE